MIVCQVCGDTNGPWYYQERFTKEKHDIPIVCEKCGKEIEKNNKKYLKEHKKGGLAV